MHLCAYLCIHVLTINNIQYIFVARVANLWYNLLLFASFCTGILSLRYILHTKHSGINFVIVQSILLANITIFLSKIL